MNAILYNGHIYPQIRIARRPTAVVISGNTISATGTDVKALQIQFPRHMKIDLKGRTVIPGLVDSHTHFYFWTRTFNTVHLDGLDSYAACLREIERFAKRNPKVDWIIGDGWSPDRWKEYLLPTAQDLDRATGNRPAALFSKDQHMLWANSAALSLAGITKKSYQPHGGRIDKDEVTGEPTGILRELPGYFQVVKLMSRSQPDLVEKDWKLVSDIARSKGVTGFHSMDGPEAFDLFTSLNGRGKLDFRAHYYFPVKMLDDVIDRGIISGAGDDTLRVGGIKLFADGSLGAQTALMKRPYAGSQDNFGVEVMTQIQLKHLIRKAVKHRLACAVHAIGDQAVANVLDAFESAGNPFGVRNRIEHLQIIDRNDIALLRKLNIIASMQPSHCPSDRKLVASYWGPRGKNAYIFKTLLQKGIPLAFGSDLPIEPLDPIAGIHAAVNRTACGERGGKFYPEQCLTVAQAVHGFTAGAAFASGREAFSGKIAPGFQADLTILEDNIYTMPPSQICGARVAATIFNGKTVFRHSRQALDL